MTLDTARAHAVNLRHKTIVQMVNEGRTTREIAIAIGASSRSIHKIIVLARSWADANGVSMDNTTRMNLKREAATQTPRPVGPERSGWVVLVSELVHHFSPSVCIRHLHIDRNTLSAWMSGTNDAIPSAKQREDIMLMVATMFARQLDVDLIDLQMGLDDIEAEIAAMKDSRGTGKGSRMSR